MSLDRTLQGIWYRRSPRWLFWLLVPLSLLFAAVAAARRVAYRIGLAKSYRIASPVSTGDSLAPACAVPVVVIGNITVGGTGKTPLVIWIAEFLAARGLRVGIVTRGYGGTALRWPVDVTATSVAREVGDEALLLSTRTQALVVAGPDRVAAAKRAAERGAQVILSDDGLQHYRLQRDVEIVVIDAERALGNGWLLPAGPLREPRARLSHVDLVVHTLRGGASRPQSSRAIGVRHELAEVINLADGQRRSIDSFAGSRVHAIAALGNPDAFFAMLRMHGLDVDAHAYPDHAVFAAADLQFTDTAPVLMTEKDAVKCAGIVTSRHWAVRLQVKFDPADQQALERVLARIGDAPRGREGVIR